MLRCSKVGEDAMACYHAIQVQILYGTIKWIAALIQEFVPLIKNNQSDVTRLDNPEWYLVHSIQEINVPRAKATVSRLR